MGPTWGLPGADRTQVGPMWATWALLSVELSNAWRTRRGKSPFPEPGVIPPATWQGCVGVGHQVKWWRIYGHGKAVCPLAAPKHRTISYERTWDLTLWVLKVSCQAPTSQFPYLLGKDSWKTMNNVISIERCCLGKADISRSCSSMTSVLVCCKLTHYNDVIMSTMMSQITSLTIVYSVVYSGVDQRKHSNSASLALCAVKFTGDRWIPRANGQ